MAICIDLQRNRTLMRQYEQAIFEVFCRKKDKDFDIIGIVDKLKTYDFINESQYTEFICEKDLGYLICKLVHVIAFHDLCLIFQLLGYSNITNELRNKAFELLYKSPARKEVPHSKRTHAYYKTLKSCVDNDSFRGGNKRDILLQFIDNQNEIICLSSTISTDRQFALERKAAATVLLIQQYKDTSDRKQILNKLIATETCGADITSLQIIYHSKMALTEAQGGNVDEAKKHILATNELCQMVGPCFALTCALHDIQYSYKSFYFRNKTEEGLKLVLREGDRAIQTLHEESEEVQNLWKRIMLLFMVLSLLGISADLVVQNPSSISKSNRKRAETILKEIRRSSDGIELRRQMIVSLCLAVVNQYKNLSTVEMYVQQALEAAQKGGCFREIERSNIEAYARHLTVRQLLSTFMPWFIICLGLCVLRGVTGEVSCYGIMFNCVSASVLLIVYRYGLYRIIG